MCSLSSRGLTCTTVWVKSWRPQKINFIHSHSIIFLNYSVSHGFIYHRLRMHHMSLVITLLSVTYQIIFASTKQLEEALSFWIPLLIPPYKCDMLIRLQLECCHFGGSRQNNTSVVSPVGKHIILLYTLWGWVRLEYLVTACNSGYINMNTFSVWNVKNRTW